MEAVETDRRDRDRLADRRHLRPRRRRRAELGADHAVLRSTASARAPGARPGSASAPRTTRKRRPPSPNASPTRPAAPSPSAGWRCQTRAASGKPRPRPRPARAGGEGFGGRRSPARPARRCGHASNWELVSARHSADGHPIAVMGPQVGYYMPQILMEEDLHGPGIDARGASFAGVNLFVQLGHGRDYAWSATTATSDNVDTFAEVLCKDELPLPLPGQVHADGKADEDRELDAEHDRLDRRRLADADRLSDRARDRLRPRQGPRPAGRLRPPAQHLLPRGGLGDRLRRAERTGGDRRRRVGSRRRSPSINFLFNWAYVDSEAHRLRALGGDAAARPRHLARLPDPRHRPVRLEGLRPEDPAGRTTCRSRSTRRPSTPTSSSPGTTSRRRAGRPPTTSTTTARSSARS